MPDDDLQDQIREMREQLDRLEATQEANEEFEREVLEEEPYGLDRLRQARRKEGYPQHLKEDDER